MKRIFLKNVLIKKTIILFLFIFASLMCITFTACGTGSDLKADIGEEFTLKIGESVKIQDTDLIFGFTGVSADSRCPKDVQCVWAGEAKIDLSVSKNGVKSELQLVLPGLGKSVETEYDDYMIIFDLEPYPEAEKEISKSDYRLVMTVKK